MQVSRLRERIRVDIGVTLTTVLESLDATVVDLTEYGAQVVGASLPDGSRFQLDHHGHSVFAVVQWSEVDRMGVKFLFQMRDGPLYDALEQARAMQRMPPSPRAPLAQPAVRQAAGFGRRLA